MRTWHCHKCLPVITTASQYRQAVWYLPFHECDAVHSHDDFYTTKDLPRSLTNRKRVIQKRGVISLTNMTHGFFVFLRFEWSFYMISVFIIVKIQKLTSEMKRSRSVDSSRYQTFCLTPSEQKVINKIQTTFFLIKKKKWFRTEPGFGL